MVDWDRVQELRSKGWDWKDIAADPKVDFHADASAGSPGRALRALYHRKGLKARPPEAPPSSGRKGPGGTSAERRWTLTRIGYLLVPLVGAWFLLAILAPSPIGLLVPAIPYLALGLAAVAFVLIYALFRRTEGRRWTSVYRNTAIGGAVAGLVLAGTIGLTGTILYGCPYLPPASSLSGIGGSGWETGHLPAWTDGGKPVVFFYGATWCPFCSASSWAIYKALTEFAGISGIQTTHSNTSDTAAGTPEVIISYLQVGQRNGNAPGVSLSAAEDTSGVRDTAPVTSSCYQQAYVTAYAQGIPFLVVNGQYVHIGTLVPPASLGPWSLQNSSAAGQTEVLNSVNTEKPVTGGYPWKFVAPQAWWISAFIAKSLGATPSTLGTLKTTYNWNTTTYNAISADLSQIS